MVSTKKGSESNSIGDVNYHRQFAPSKSPLVASKTTIHLVGLLVFGNEVEGMGRYYEKILDSMGITSKHGDIVG